MPASIFNGDSVKILKDKLKFKSNDTIEKSGEALKVTGSAGQVTNLDNKKGLELFEMWNSDQDLASNWTNTGSGTFTIFSGLSFGGNSSYRFTTAAQNDQIKRSITLDIRRRNILSQSCAFFYLSSLAGMEAIIYDVTNATERERIVLPAVSGTFSKVTIPYTILDTTASIELRFENTHLTNAPLFQFNDIQFSDDPLTYKNLTEYDSYRATSHAGFGSTNTKIPYFTTVQSNNTGKAISISNDSINGFSITAIRNCEVTVTRSVKVGAATFSGFSLNSATPATSISLLPIAEVIAIEYQGAAGQTSSFSTTHSMLAGDIIRPHDDGVAPSAGYSTISVNAQSESEYVLSPATISTEDAITTLGAAMVVSSHTIDNISKLGTLSQSGTYTFTASKKVNVLVSASLSTQTANFTQVRINKNGSVVSYSSTPNVATTTTGASAEMVLNPGDVLTITSASGTAAGGFATLLVSDYNASFLAAIPKRSESIINVHATNFFTAVTATAASGTTTGFKVIPLVSISGDSSYLTISGNQITLLAGEYKIVPKAAPYNGAQSMDVRIWNVTDSLVIDDMLNIGYSTLSGVVSYTDCPSIFTVTKTTVIEVQARSLVAAGQEYYGRIELSRIGDA